MFHKRNVGKNGQEIVPADMVKMIEKAGLHAARRNTLYQTIEKFERSATLELVDTVCRQTIPVMEIASSDNALMPRVSGALS